MKKEVLYLEGRRDAYCEEDVYDEGCGTWTVGELIDYLSDEYNRDTPIMLNNDNGYTFGSITYGSFNIGEFEIEEEEEEEEYSEEYESAMEQLDNITELTYTEYNYYCRCIDDLYYKDKTSAKNGECGYTTFEDVLADARRCAENIKGDDEDDNL